MTIKDRVIIVTGASSGIGLATAKLLAKKGAKVALVARSEDKLDDLTHQLPGSLSRPTDMSDVGEVRKMVQDVKHHYGRIDILINCAGQGYDAHVENTNLDSFRHIFDLDLVGPLIAMQEVMPFMKAQGKGSIINISSGTALMHLPNMGAYAAIKSALAHLSLTAREELEQDNINVSVVYPYITLTDFEKHTIKERFVSDKETINNNGYVPPKADTAEYVAKKIVDCIKSDVAEVFAHDWMRQPG